ncbi:NF-X1 finger transcription factor [Purpureocillium lilacinum]|uniref:NF-X1 finger transcription factor n=1 Tax=Purpureocillium lilacinum TaxID=33203 RepID=A0A2U3EIM7_PURLI|nr:NF-X1 finger transcription factor [Purpureocillium lilacinum]
MNDDSVGLGSAAAGLCREAVVANSKVRFRPKRRKGKVRVFAATTDHWSIDALAACPLAVTHSDGLVQAFVSVEQGVLLLCHTGDPRQGGTPQTGARLEVSPAVAFRTSSFSRRGLIISSPRTFARLTDPGHRNPLRQAPRNQHIVSVAGPTTSPQASASQVMPDADTPQVRTQSQDPSRRGHHGRRRARGGRARGPVDGSHRGGSNAPGDDVASQASLPTPSAPRTSNEPSRASGEQRARRGRGQRGGGRGASGRGAAQPPAHRAFGGHLTTGTDDATPSARTLSGDAPEFVPGQPLATRTKRPKAPVSQEPHVKQPKSTAADLGTRIHDDISNWNYECAICTDDVLRTSHVWSCTVCWTVVHLKCAKRCESFRGDAPDAIPNSSTTPALTIVGAARKSIHHQPAQLCPLIHVDKPARNPGQPVLIPALSNATPDPVPPVVWWDQTSRVSAARTLPRSYVGRRIMKMVGAVRRHAKTCSRAASISAHGPVTPACAASVTSKSRRDATAAV